MSKSIVTSSGKEVKCVTNITELRDSLLDLYNQHKAGVIDNNTTKVQVMAAGVIIASIRTEMAYNEMRDEKPSIKFLNKAEN